MIVIRVVYMKLYGQKYSQCFLFLSAIQITDGP